MLKWIAAIVILTASIVLSATMLQAMGLVDFRALVLTQVESIPQLQDATATYRLGLETERALAEERREVALLRAELGVARLEVEDERRRLETVDEQLARRSVELDQRERVLRARAEGLDAQTRNLQDLGRLQAVYGAMRPRDLVPILAELEDNVIVQIMAGLDDRQVASVLAELSPERAARISKLVGGISTK